MTGIPVLHVQVRVEPGRTGSLEPHAPPPRSDTQGLPHGQQAQAEHSSRGAETAASGPRRTPAGLRAAGRQSAVATIAAGSTGSRLPDAYIGAPQGDLRSDPQHAGVLTDESGQRYIAAGKHYYAIRHDPASGTWRAIQRQDPGKPGIPVELAAAGWRPHAVFGLRGGRPNDPRVEVERLSLLSARDGIRRDIHNLAAQESDAHRLSEDFRREKDRAAAAANEARNRNEDAVLYEQLVDVTNSKLLEAVQVLRGIRDALLARNGELRDVERSLALLPPPK